MFNVIVKTKKKIRSTFFVDYDKDHRNSIFLAATGRSGSTWVSNIINYRNEYRYVFEPFHLYKINACNSFKYRQYLRPDNRDKKFIEPATRILSGNLRYYWVDARNRKVFANKRLIKDIRANLLLKWIYDNFSQIPIILLLRHPCAVANSKLKMNWGTHLQEFLSQEELVEDYLFPFKKEIERAESNFEKHIFLWCIENYVPLQQFKNGGIHLAFYENFCMDPVSEVERMFSFLNKKYDEKIFRKIKKPSELTRKGSAIITGESLIDTWKKNISKEQVKRAENILNIFGLDKIYSRESLPDTAKALEMMKGTSATYTEFHPQV